MAVNALDWLPSTAASVARTVGLSATGRGATRCRRKTSMRRLTTAIVAALIAVGTAGAAPPAGHGARPVAGHGGGAPGYGPLSLLPFLLASADLTDAQKQQVNELVRARGDRFRTLFAELRKVNEELSDRIFEPGKLTADELEPLTEKVLDLRGQLLRENMAVVIGVRAILTPEQLAKAASARKALKERGSSLPPGHPPTGAGTVEN
ncbi:MAG: periplasmic heavy metal sensor [Candidatus Dadabacteria bacterium]|nr:MAG: periplasmic heavy metal sensor [Candidatus Dadabacteria bacterium]